MKVQRLVSSKLLDKKWKSRDQQIHKQKLREVKSAVRPLQDAPFGRVNPINNKKKE